MKLPSQTRLKCLPDEDLFVCVRHGGNTWPITGDWHREPDAWQRVGPPAFYPQEVCA